MGLSSDPKKRAKQLANRRNAPPAPKGHKRALKHGGHATPSADVLAAHEQSIRDALPVRGHDGGPPAHDAVSVKLLATVLAQLDAVTDYLAQHGQLIRGGGVRPASDLQLKLLARAEALTDRLGMNPTSRAKLGLTLAQTQDLAQAMSDLDDAHEDNPNTIDATVEDDTP